MNFTLRIAVADDDPSLLRYYQKVLPDLGHEVCCTAATGRELVECCRDVHPDLVIADIRLPELDGIAASGTVYAECRVPTILVSGYCEDELGRYAGAEHVMAVLAKPITRADLAPAIALAVRRFAQQEELRRETAGLRQALEDRKVIERAKGLLMKKARLDEPDAFRRLQQLARENNKKLVEIARTVLLAEQAFEVPMKA